MAVSRVDARRGLADAALLEKLRGLRDLALALPDAGLVHPLVRHGERARAFAEHAPLAMMPQHCPRDAKALRATGGLLRRNGGLDRLPLGGDPAAIDFQKKSEACRRSAHRRCRARNPPPGRCGWNRCRNSQLLNSLPAASTSRLRVSSGARGNGFFFLIAGSGRR